MDSSNPLVGVNELSYFTEQVVKPLSEDVESLKASSGSGGGVSGSCSAMNTLPYINSDYVNEPLNFNNYINDISVFGAESYVLDKSNENLFHALLSQSLTMFGHDAIHEYVYNRLTDADVDVMIQDNPRLGQSFNSFYNTDVFVNGDIDAVLSGITSTEFNVLELKLQSGIVRYISSKTDNETAAEWISSVFGVDMSSYTTAASILADTDFWTNTVMNNQSMLFVICSSYAAIDFISDTTGDIFTNFIKTASNSVYATDYLISALNGVSRLDEFFANETVCNIITSKEEAMTAICYNLQGFSAFISSTVAMTCVQNSEVAQDVIVNAIIVIADTETKLNEIHTALDTINTDITSLKDGDKVVDEIKETKTKITDCLNSIHGVTDKADILAENVAALLSNKVALETLLAVDHVFVTLANSSANEKVAQAVVALALGKAISNLRYLGSGSSNTRFNTTDKIVTTSLNYVSYGSTGYYTISSPSTLVKISGNGSTTLCKMFYNFSGVYTSGYYPGISVYGYKL